MLAVAAGCEANPLAPPLWTAVTDTAVIYSLAKPQLDLLSAFNFRERAPVRIETTGGATQWDIALDTRAGQLVLLPPGALGVQSAGRIMRLANSTFASVEEAPKDTLVYSATQALPVDLKSVYVIKTDRRVTEFGGACSYYAKMAPIAADVAAGTLRFIYDASPLCNDRKLVPPDTT